MAANAVCRLNADIPLPARESGAYLSTFKMGQVSSMQFGTCVPAPFTGFPSRKF